MSSTRDQLVRLLREKAYREGDFTLASGRKASFYIDARQVTYDPAGATLAGQWVFELVRDRNVQAVGGLTLGADPIALATALTSHLQGAAISAFVVRKAAKGHGLKRSIEGPPLGPGMRVAIVEDVVTSGGSAIEAITRVREEAGCEIALVACLVDREEGGREAIEAQGCRLHALCTISELRAAGRSATVASEGASGNR
ncbi:MAG TPA: orotate phosphoribosyltransferase [Gemmatimonadales bacterium]